MPNTKGSNNTSALLRSIESVATLFSQFKFIFILPLSIFQC